MGGIIIENRRETHDQTQNGWHYYRKQKRNAQSNPEWVTLL